MAANTPYCFLQKIHTERFMKGIDDKVLRRWLAPLTPSQRTTTAWRDARRKAIREAIRRGLIDKDPLNAP